MPTIYFDMDGTIADLYGVENWLSMLRDFDPTPYISAKPLVNMAWFARTVHEFQKMGWKIGIISWLSKTSTENYDNEVKRAKENWLKSHIPSVEFDEIHIVKYGTPKSSCGNGYLFDDEEKNRVEWGEGSFGVENLLKTFRNILREN